ncbi:hypothetical protein H0E87_008470, partial [Populus deltoides]
MSMVLVLLAVLVIADGCTLWLPINGFCPALGDVLLLRFLWVVRCSCYKIAIMAAWPLGGKLAFLLASGSSGCCGRLPLAA